MRILRTPNNLALVIISEAEGVTDDDLGVTMSQSASFQSLFDACEGEMKGMLPLGAPSSVELGGYTRSTKLIFAPPIMWFQQHPDYWETVGVV